MPYHAAPGLGISEPMLTDPPRRISGTYWERFLVLAFPIPALAFIPYVMNNGRDVLTSGFWEAPLFMIIFALLIWMVDYEPIARQKPVRSMANGMLEIGAELVRPTDVLAIVPLRRSRQASISVFEIRYDGQGANAAPASCRSPIRHCSTFHMADPGACASSSDTTPTSLSASDPKSASSNELE